MRRDFFGDSPSSVFLRCAVHSVCESQFQTVPVRLRRRSVHVSHTLVRQWGLMGKGGGGGKEREQLVGF